MAYGGDVRHRFTLRSGSVEISVAASPQMTVPALDWRMNKTYHAACVVAVRDEQALYSDPGAAHSGSEHSVHEAKT
jgi:hypothetical protein